MHTVGESLWVQILVYACIGACSLRPTHTLLAFLISPLYFTFLWIIPLKSGADPKALTASSTATVALLAAVWALSSAAIHPHAVPTVLSSSSSMELLYSSGSDAPAVTTGMPQSAFLGAFSEVQHDLSALAEDAGGAVVYLAVVATGLATWIQVSEAYPLGKKKDVVDIFSGRNEVRCMSRFLF